MHLVSVQALVLVVVQVLAVVGTSALTLTPPP